MLRRLRRDLVWARLFLFLLPPLVVGPLSAFNIFLNSVFSSGLAPLLFFTASSNVEIAVAIVLLFAVFTAAAALRAVLVTPFAVLKIIGLLCNNALAAFIRCCGVGATGAAAAAAALALAALALAAALAALVLAALAALVLAALGEGGAAAAATTAAGRGAGTAAAVAAGAAGGARRGGGSGC